MMTFLRGNSDVLNRLAAEMKQKTQPFGVI